MGKRRKRKGGMTSGVWHRVKVKRYHKSLNVEPIFKLGSNLFGCIGGLKVEGKQVELEGSEQKCEGCKGCRARSSRLTSTHRYLSNDVRRTKSWPSFMLNNNV